MQYEFKHTFLNGSVITVPTLVLPGNSRRYGLIYAGELDDEIAFFSGQQGMDGKQWYRNELTDFELFNYQDFGPLLQAEIYMTKNTGFRATLTEILKL